MGYYRGSARGDYYRTRGDYYRNRGDWGSTALNFARNLFVPGPSIQAITKTIAPSVAAVKALAASPAGKIATSVGGGLATGLAVNKMVNYMSGPPTVEIGGRQYALPGSRRRINPSNPKALRRALRRVAGFGKLARRARRDIGRAATAVGVVRHRAKGRFGKR